MKLFLTIFFVFTFIFVAYGATFLPIDIRERMKNSDFVVRGKYLGKSYKKTASGSVVTEHTFKLIESVGIDQNEIVNKNSFKVISPGGVWNGLNYKVTGTPKFSNNEEVVLMLSKGRFGLVFPDLSMSKFKVLKKYGKEVLVADVFPDRENIGKISLDDFKMLTSEVYGDQLKKIEFDKFVYKRESKKSRGIASISNEEEKEASAKELSFFWLAVILAALGAYWTRVNKSRRD